MRCLFGAQQKSTNELDTLLSRTRLHLPKVLRMMSRDVTRLPTCWFYIALILSQHHSSNRSLEGDKRIQPLWNITRYGNPVKMFIYSWRPVSNLRWLFVFIFKGSGWECFAYKTEYRKHTRAWFTTTHNAWLSLSKDDIYFYSMDVCFSLSLLLQCKHSFRLPKLMAVNSQRQNALYPIPIAPSDL